MHLVDVAFLVVTSGMTARSLLPDSARTGGIDFPELCTRFIEFALEDRQ